MPQYDYACKKCKKNFTLFTSIAEYVEKPACTHCKSVRTTPVYNIPVVRDDTHQTLGSWADRNSAKLGEDGMAKLKSKHTEYMRDSELNRRYGTDAT